MSEQEHSVENLKHEYAEVTGNMRHYSNMRFIIFSVFSAITGGIALLAFSDGGVTSNTPIFAEVGGLLITLIFWVYEERWGQVFLHFKKVAIELESKLGYIQISTMPPGKFPVLEAKYTTRIFFVLWTVLWSAALANLL